MSGSLKNDNNTMSKSKFIKVVVSSEFADTKNFMMEVNSKVSTLKKEIFDRCGLENMEIYWKSMCHYYYDIKKLLFIDAFLLLVV